MTDEDVDHDADSILHKHADAHIVLAKEIGALARAGRAQLDIVQALEHRLVVLESRMENVMARLDGHDLGFATLSLDEKGKAALARMMRLGEKGRPIVPGEEGTSES